MVQFLEGRNRAWAQLDAPINGSDTNVALVAGQGSRLSDVTTASGRKVRAQIYERDAETGAITKCELVDITNNVSDVLTIERTVESTRATDTTNTYAAAPQSFSSSAIIEEVISSEVMSEMREEINRLEDDKLDKSVYDAERVVYGASSAGDDDYEVLTGDSLATVADGRVFAIRADVANTGASTLKIDGTAALALKKISSGAFADLSTGDIIANQIFFAIKNTAASCYQFSIDPANIAFPDVVINGKTEKTSFDLDDEIVIYDIDGTANKKQKFKSIFGHSFEAGENIAVDDAVYISTSDNKAYRTDATSTTKIQVVGFALNTVTTGQTVYVGFSPKIESGNIYLQSTNTQSTTYNSIDTGTNSFGYKITTTKACSIVSITKSESCTATRAKVLDSAGTVINTATFSGDTATFSSPVALANATVYRIECDKIGASYTFHTKSGSTFNSSTDFNYTAGSHNGGDSNGPSGQTMNTYGFNIVSVVTAVTSLVKTPGTPYFLSDIPGKINSVGGTYKCKVGIALTSALLAFQPQIKDTYIT